MQLLSRDGHFEDPQLAENNLLLPLSHFKDPSSKEMNFPGHEVLTKD